MRAEYRSLAGLQAEANRVFGPGFTYSAVSLATYADGTLLTLASQLGAQVPPAPMPDSQPFQPGTSGGVDTHSAAGNFVDSASIPISVPGGYEIQSVELDITAGVANGANNNHGSIKLVGYQPEISIDVASANDTRNYHVKLDQDPDWPDGFFMRGLSGSPTIELTCQAVHPLFVVFRVTWAPAASTVAQWQADTYSALYNAAQTAYYAQQQTIAAQITTLEAKLNNVDTLTLRREENDEIMKCVLRWLLGNSFEFMPVDVIEAFAAAGTDLQYGVGFTGSSSGMTFDTPGEPPIVIPLPSADWTTLGYHEEVISFINQAIDWDSTLFFLYSYFWDVPESWAFIRQIQHPDATRQAFLRAGSARVVLCVREGWETAWTQFVEFWSRDIGGDLPIHPYLTIASEIESYDSTNYPGIPAANPTGPYDETTPQVGTTSHATVGPSKGQVEITVASNSGFVVGATAIIDSWSSGVQETQQIMAVSADGTRITVQALTNPHTPSNDGNDPFPVVQAGAQGVLIAEWFEYTPSSGTDIAVSSNLAEIS